LLDVPSAKQAASLALFLEMLTTPKKASWSLSSITSPKQGFFSKLCVTMPAQMISFYKNEIEFIALVLELANYVPLTKSGLLPILCLNKVLLEQSYVLVYILSLATLGMQ
jgi:hypothetical protein